MSRPTPDSHEQASAELPQTLTDRVLAQVQAAALTVDRRANATRPKASRSRPVAPDPLSADVTRTAEQIREARSLRRVFSDMGDTYRDYRHRSGAPVSPGLRAAAYRFKRELDVTSLVSVAAIMDDLDILTW